MNCDPQLQAHRGVSTEYPENTMSAFRASISQGYDVIELDPNYTKDGEIVILHDKTINKTARRTDGSAIQEPTPISELTYSEALEYEYGSFLSLKFKGEKLPLLEEALELAAKNNIKAKLDNKIEGFPERETQKLYSLIDKYEPYIAITTGKVEMIRFYAQRFPVAELHYDGPVDEDILNEISVFSDRLTVWMPYECPLTSWVKVPFASEKLCNKVKKIAKLGIWIIKDYQSYDDVCKRFAPDIVETTGAIKPVANQNILCDMHDHSKNSHDSKCPVSDHARSAIEKNISVFAVTDHCDIQYYEIQDSPTRITNSVKEARQEAENFCGKVKILTGVEIGEGIWDQKRVSEILAMNKYDVVISSVHAVRYKDLCDPYSTIDFSKIDKEIIIEYLDKYFDEVAEMLEKIPCDVMAHLTCPLRYINGKYNREIDLSVFNEKIEKILKYIIKHAIALEINTSGINTSFNSFMPDEQIIKKFKELGGYLVTIGSDAHVSERIGNGLEDAIALLRKYGFRNYYYYQNRENIQCTL